MRAAIVMSTLGVLALSVVGCAPSPRPTPTRARLDKAAIYGDAALVPTREGERMRRQLAIAGQLERAVATLSFVESVAVDVDDAASPPRAVAVVRLRPGHADDEVAAALDRLGNAIAPVEIRWVLDANPDEAPSPAPASWPLVLGLLGLGLSLGVTIERWRRAGGLAALRGRPGPR